LRQGKTKLLSALLKSLSGSDWWVTFANADEYSGQYKNAVLIGSYTRHAGIPIKQAKNRLKEGISAQDFYDLTGYRKELA